MKDNKGKRIKDKFGIILFLSLILYPLSFIPSAEAATYYAGTLGLGGSCAQYQNIATKAPTIAAALACMTAAGGGGHTLYITAGTYSENGLLIPSGTSGAYNTVASYGTDNVIFTSLDDAFYLYNNGRRYINIVGSACTGLNRSCGMTFNNSSISLWKTAEGGPEFLTFDKIRVRNVVVGGGRTSGVAINIAANNITVKNCRMDHNGTTPDSEGQAGYPFYIGGNNNLVENCELDNNGGFAIHSYSTDQSPSFNTYRYNFIHDNGQLVTGNVADGILLSGCQQHPDDCPTTTPTGNAAYGNVIWNNARGYGVRLNRCLNCNVYNNTVYNNGHANGAGGIYVQNASGTTNIKNNISSNNNFQFYHEPSQSPTYSANLCSGTGTGCDFVEPAATTFVTPGSDFRLKDTSSLAVNRGDNLGSPYNADIAGATRPTTGPWEVGAYEYGVPVVPVSPQLVLALPLDEGSGTIATDVSGQKNNANLVGGATWTSGKYGQAIQFDGTGYLNIPASSTLALSSGVTLEAWIYPTVAFSSFIAVIRHEFYYLYAATSAGICPSPSLAPFGGYSSATAAYRICATALPPINQWSHLAVTHDGSTLVFYLNGNPIASQSSADPMASGTTNLSIGASTYGVVSDYFTGRIDEPRVYNYARTPAQILSDMNTPLIGVPGKYVEIAPATSVEISSASSIEIGAD